MQIVPSQILSYRYKNERSVAFKNTPKSVFCRGSAPDPAEGAHDAPPDPWRGGTPPYTPHHSARTPRLPSEIAMRLPPEVQPDLRLWCQWL